MLAPPTRGVLLLHFKHFAGEDPQSALADLVKKQQPTSILKPMEPTHRTSPKDERKEEEKPRSFVPETSSAKFELTEQESSKLDSLFQWQDSSSRSTIVLGKPLNF